MNLARSLACLVLVSGLLLADSVAGASAGAQPDVAVPASQARRAAYRRALEALLAEAAKPTVKARLEKALTALGE